jgi:hypothetical protein
LGIEITEASIQSAFFEWLSLYSRLRLATFAIPNGGSRNCLEAKNLKAQGVTPGVPDIFMAVPCNGYHGLFIELKSKNGRLSEHQKVWVNNLNDRAYEAVVCYSLDEAMDAVSKYLRGNLNNV